MPHDRPPRAWAKVGIDLFVICTRNFSITVDYWSKIFEIDQLWSTDTAAVVKCLKRNFARYGTPDEVITDNGPQFTSTVFFCFCWNMDVSSQNYQPLPPTSQWNGWERCENGKDVDSYGWTFRRWRVDGYAGFQKYSITRNGYKSGAAHV